MNFKYTYSSGEDVLAKCVRRRSAFSIVNKELVKPNQSSEFIRAQTLQQKGLGGTTIFITMIEDSSQGNQGNQVVQGIATSNTPAGTEYIKKCPLIYKRKTVLPLTNKF